MITLVAVIALCAGCGDRRSFDERFSDSQNEIDERAESIDRDLENGTSEPRKEDSSAGEGR